MKTTTLIKVVTLANIAREAIQTKEHTDDKERAHLVRSFWRKAFTM